MIDYNKSKDKEAEYSIMLYITDGIITDIEETKAR
jgi:hypothetical protein